MCVLAGPEAAQFFRFPVVRGPSAFQGASQSLCFSTKTTRKTVPALSETLQGLPLVRALRGLPGSPAPLRVSARLLQSRLAKIRLLAGDPACRD